MFFGLRKNKRRIVIAGVDEFGIKASALFDSKLGYDYEPYLSERDTIEQFIKQRLHGVNQDETRTRFKDVLSLARSGSPIFLICLSEKRAKQIKEEAFVYTKTVRNETLAELYREDKLYKQLYHLLTKQYKFKNVYIIDNTNSKNNFKRIKKILRRNK